MTRQIYIAGPVGGGGAGWQQAATRCGAHEPARRHGVSCHGRCTNRMHRIQQAEVCGHELDMIHLLQAVTFEACLHKRLSFPTTAEGEVTCRGT